MKHFLLIALTFVTVAPGQSLRVMTFNVRYPNPKDGADVWENRRDLLAGAVRRHHPDVMGTQELFKLQGDFITATLPDYAWFGVSRRGNEQDEHMGVFYRKAALRVVENGNFWLSETPEVAGSSSWKMSLPRMVTWALFEHNKTRRRFYFFNTHFAHREQDEAARLESARVIQEHLAKLGAKLPIVLTGDFNASATGAVHERMLATGLIDSRAIAKRKEGPEGTFHGFRGKPGEARIDWILLSPGIKVKRNATLLDQKGGRFPSDHFPVSAELTLD